MRNSIRTRRRPRRPRVADTVVGTAASAVAAVLLCSAVTLAAPARAQIAYQTYIAPPASAGGFGITELLGAIDADADLTPEILYGQYVPSVSDDIFEIFYPFYTRDGQFRDIASLLPAGSTNVGLYGASEAGLGIGAYTGGDGVQRLFSLDFVTDTLLLDISTHPTPGQETYFFVFSVGTGGEVLLESVPTQTPGEPYQNYLRRPDGTFTSFTAPSFVGADSLGLFHTFAGLNASGAYAFRLTTRDESGQPNGNNFYTGVLDDPASGQRVAVPFGQNVSPGAVRGLNDLGDLVGNYADASTGTNQGFARSAATGDFFRIRFPEAQSLVVSSISNSGVITGRYTTAGGDSRGFITTLSAVQAANAPEPSALALISPALPLVGALAARRRRKAVAA